jgi:hypothetical protein
MAWFGWPKAALLQQHMCMVKLAMSHITGTVHLQITAAKSCNIATSYIRSSGGHRVHYCNDRFTRPCFKDANMRSNLLRVVLLQLSACTSVADQLTEIWLPRRKRLKHSSDDKFLYTLPYSGRVHEK